MRYPINNNGGRGRGNGGRGGFRPRNPGSQNNPRHHHQRQQYRGSRPYRPRAPRSSFRPQNQHQGQYQHNAPTNQNIATPQNAAPQNSNGATNNTPVTTRFQNQRDERAKNNSPVPGPSHGYANATSHGPSTSKRKRPHSPTPKEEYIAGNISHELALQYYFYYKSLKKRVYPTKRYD